MIVYINPKSLTPRIHFAGGVICGTSVDCGVLLVGEKPYHLAMTEAR